MTATRQLAAIMPARRSFSEGGFTDLSTDLSTEALAKEEVLIRTKVACFVKSCSYKTLKYVQ